ncbi:hypothetical protein IAG25_35465 [Caballeronia sp. EK]|uniref:hypothetical protein n=1 Tax=Caballeronia sp. EK TaxID=2767469 RepID=UPI00165564E1|nr:hypothetical protein [Caballeronia sp. EK]MBC8642107.1 hypothetical protein [Caballeronia sp. EK]
MNLAKTMRIADYATARVKADADDAQLEFEDAKEAAAKEVTFDDVLEELTELPETRKIAVMSQISTDGRHFAFRLEAVFTDAIEKIAKRRAWAEITKARGG